MKVTKSQIFILFVIYISVFCDAVRDAQVVRCCEWWSWHIAKWISVFSIWLMLLWKAEIIDLKLWRDQRRLWIIYAAIGSTIWWLGAQITLK